MIKIVSKFLVPRGFAGISIGPVIIARRRDMLDNPIFLTHEYIHFFQQLELLFIGFWVLYPLLYLIGRLRGKSNDGAYRDNPFEREAYANQADAAYLINRRFFAWMRRSQPR